MDLDDLSPEQLKQVLKYAQGLLQDKDEEEAEPTKTQKSPSKKPTKSPPNQKRPSRVEPMIITRDRPNYFEERFGDFHRDESVKKNPKMGVANPTPRGRGNNLVEVTCSNCGNVGIVSAQLINTEDGEARYRCNRCL